MTLYGIGKSGRKNYETIENTETETQFDNHVIHTKYLNHLEMTYICLDSFFLTHNVCL